MAPTVTFVLFFGLVKEIYDLLKLCPGDKMARNLMIGTGFFASISCAMTPIAHTFPLMALGYYEAATGVAISYFAFMQLSIPICLLIAVAAYLLLIKGIDKKFDFNSLHFERTNWTWQEIVALIVFIGVVICWLVVGIWPTTFVALNALGTIWPALVGIIILMACGILNIKEACSKGVAWPAILLCGTTLALGKYIAATEYGIIPLISSLFVNVNPASILFIIIAFTIILTNLISNIVTTTLSYNLFVPMIMASGMVSPVIATILIGICASLAYALPSSIAHIALAGSSGWATANDMMKYGTILGIISIIIIGVIILL
jgi:sodium-dependent dicarboxylate transporter 2/3/5